MFYAGDYYNFILNIPALGPGTTTITSPYVLITVLDILDPGSPIVSGAHMTLVAGTSYLYYYSFTAPNASPKDYVAIYSYATSYAESLGTATAATDDNTYASFTFPLPLPTSCVPGALLTTTGFTTSSGSGNFNVSGIPIRTVNQSTGVVVCADAGTSMVVGTKGTGSIATDVTVSNQSISLTDHLHIGDSYITGQVALNATVAQNSTVAKDATVFKSSQWVAPQNDPLVQTINTAVQTIFTNSNTEIVLLGTLAEGTLSGLIQDIYDNLFGTWTIDQTVSPPILYINRVGGGNIASFQLINNASTTQRNVLTHPPESSV
jgi:hypothetical protein